MSDDYAGELDHMDVDIPVPPRIPFQRQPVKTNLNAKKVKNVHLKGRKRFMADLEDLKTGGLMEAYGLGINCAFISFFKQIHTHGIPSYSSW